MTHRTVRSWSRSRESTLIDGAVGMRIVQLLPNLDIGGMERLAVDLARRQKIDGHHPFIYCTSHPGQLAPEAEAAGAVVHAFGKTDGVSPRLVLRLAQRLRKDPPAVLP